MPETLSWLFCLGRSVGSSPEGDREPSLRDHRYYVDRLAHSQSLLAVLPLAASRGATGSPVPSTPAMSSRHLYDAGKTAPR